MNGGKICHTGLAADAHLMANEVKTSMWMILLIVLGIFSYWDIRKKELPGKLLVVILLISVVITVVKGLQKSDAGVIWMIVTGMGPGGLLLLLAFVTREKLGYGDGLVLMIIGNLVGVEQCMFMLSLAILLSFGFSCLLLVFFRKNRNDSFPFVPFYFLGGVLTFVVF